MSIYAYRRSSSYAKSGITRMIERTLETMKYLKTDSIDTIRNTGVMTFLLFKNI